jgi:hypothetical protein
MPKLTDREIARHVVNGGFTGDNRVIGVAVVLAESGGRTDARGDVGIQTSKWGPSIGLFQIRSLKAQRGSGGTRDELANLDPATNARHAHVVFIEAGNRWTPWSTFKHKTHEQFMDRARQAVEAAGSGGSSATLLAAEVVVDDDGLSPAEAGEIMARLEDLRHDMVVHGTHGLAESVEDLARRQREALAKLKTIDKRLNAIEQRLGPAQLDRGGG